MAAVRNSQKLCEAAPHEAGQRPAEEIAHHGGELPAELICQNAGKEREKHLHHHGDGEDEADLHVRDPLRIHVQRGERRDEIVGDAPQRLDQHERARVSAIVRQHLHEGVLPHAFSDCPQIHTFSSLISD